MKLPILTMDVPNLNRRIYPREVFQKVIDKYTKEHVSERRALIVNKLPENSFINLKDAVGIVKEIIIEGDKVMVEAEFFSDSYRQIIESGKCFLRTSGMGTLRKDENGNDVVQEDYELISCFITDDPA